MKQIYEELKSRNKVIEYFFYADYLLMELELNQKENKKDE